MFEVDVVDHGQRLLRTLAGKFKFARQMFIRMTGTIIPVINVEPMLMWFEIKTHSMDLTGAGYVVADTCPTGEKWYLRVGVAGPSTGNQSLSVTIGGELMRLEDQATAQRAGIDLFDLPLEAGDSYGSIGSANGADGAISNQFGVFKEKQL